MSAAQATAKFTQYPQESPRIGRGLLISVGVHLFLAILVCVIMFLLGIQSLKELLEKGGAIAQSGPAPEQMVVVLKLDNIPLPPTDHIEFIKQILKPKPVVVKPPPPPPKPVPKPIVRVKPRFTAPKATGAGVSANVSAFIKGSSGLPYPSYPYAALQAGEGGTVLMHVVFDSSGGITSADIMSSSGVTLLDVSTRNFIYGHWKNASLANKSVSVPIIYDPNGTVH